LTETDRLGSSDGGLFAETACSVTDSLLAIDPAGHFSEPVALAVLIATRS